MGSAYEMRMVDAETMLETTESIETGRKESDMLNMNRLTELFRDYGLVEASEDGLTAETVQTVDNSEHLQMLHEDLTVTIRLLIFIAGFQLFLFGMAVLVFIYRVIKNNVTRYI